MPTVWSWLLDSPGGLIVFIGLLEAMFLLIVFTNFGFTLRTAFNGFSLAFLGTTAVAIGLAVSGGLNSLLGLILFIFWFFNVVTGAIFAGLDRRRYPSEHLDFERSFQDKEENDEPRHD